jgi:hypothetical protein
VTTPGRSTPVATLSLAMVAGLAGVVVACWNQGNAADGGAAASAADQEASKLCLDGCNKSKECFGGSLGMAIDCKQSCNGPNVGNTTTRRCSNAGAITAKARECLSTPCMEYLACLEMVPVCERGTADAGVAGSDAS